MLSTFSSELQGHGWMIMTRQGFEWAEWMSLLERLQSSGVFSSRIAMAGCLSYEAANKEETAKIKAQYE